MNNFFGLKPGYLLDELNYIKKLGLEKKKENEIWNKFCLNCKSTENDVEVPRNFSSHPKRLDSETDASVVSSRRSLSSKSSNPNVDMKDIRSVLQENKFKIQKARRNLNQNRSKTSNSDFHNLNLGMGDSCSVTSHEEAAADKIITHYDNVEKIEENADTCRKDNTPVTPSKRAASALSTVRSTQSTVRSSQRPLQAQNSYRNIVTDSVFEKKFKIFVEKSLITISDIRSLLECGINPPDGEEDVSRRTIRVKEFSNRFSRNYLYPLARQLEELSEMVCHHPNLNQKLLSSYQVILNGLQAYHNHLPTSIGSCSSDRLKTLLKQLLQLCDIHGRFVKHPEENVDCDFISTFKMNAELTLQKIEDHFSARSSESGAKANNATKGGYQRRGLTTGTSTTRKSGMTNRFSMYRIPAGNFRNDVYYRKMMHLWAKKGANVKSRYKTATYRHRPPVDRQQQQQSELQSGLSKSKIMPKKPTGMSRKTPLTTPVNEDNITTLIQIEDRKEAAVGTDNQKVIQPATAARSDHDTIVMTLLQLVLNNRGGAKKDGESDPVDGAAGCADAVKVAADILERIKAGEDVEELRKALEAVRMGKEKKEEVREEGEKQLKLEIVGSQSGVEEVAVKKRKEPIITVTGEKNAKLICITDENSIIETEDDPKSEDKDNSTEKQQPPKVCSTETQTIVTSNKKNKGTQKAKKHASFKMKRLPKSSKCLQKLPRDHAVNIIQYKLDFHRHCKQNPMYKKTSNLEPWALVTKISDRILDHALLGVAREIELNDVAQQLYYSELQI